MVQVNVVWLKRDIRWRDHEALNDALKEGIPVIIIHFFEPSLMAAKTSSNRHWRFVFESLKDLENTIQPKSKNKNSINIAHCEVEMGFHLLSQHFNIKKVFSYQETGNAITYARDKSMAKWMNKRGIKWTELQTNGVQRGRKNRIDWSAAFEQRMTSTEVFPDLKNAELVCLNKALNAKLNQERLPHKITKRDSRFQPGGESWAIKYLKSFLTDRSRNYSKGISKPEWSRKTCSRLSPYLTWGNISMRTLFNEMDRHYDQIPNKRAVINWRSRLYWHCHFIQKFEMEERYEFENINRGFDVMPLQKNGNYIKAWEEGKTGYPLVDACMRCVAETGYLNFRMRAMVVSFLTHNLLQPWQTGTGFLARNFLDYEPGIHYPQFQMQAGMTGTNTFRIYNVVKQAEEHDPKAEFIKKWVPELRELPTEFALKPWEMTDLEQSMYSFKLGVDYPKPIVDHEETARQSKRMLTDVMKTERAKLEAKRILATHVRLSDKKAHRSKSDQLLKAKLEKDA
ncbi:MAG: deoxyribodipyrimidine photo-lyase [Bacteroidia bacterium]